MSMTPEQIKLADAVAVLLNLQLAPGYEDHWSRTFALPDGGRLYSAAGRQRGHLHISASVADHLREHRRYYRDGEAPKTSINASDSKPADRIAADIRRRLLPEHEKESTACAAQKGRHDDNNARRILALTKVAAAFGEHVQCDERSGEGRRGRCWSDQHNNVYILKGDAELYPCVAAHTDTVHPMREVKIIEQDGMLVGFDDQGRRVGIGADDKSGVYICLELLEQFQNIAVAFFAGEELCCRGAYAADPAFFEKVGYVVAFDGPARGLVSYTAGGVRLFQNDGDFIRRALPVLNRHGAVNWQRHPFTDVMALRERFTFSCMNLSCGYYNWHASDEFLKLEDTAAAVEMGHDLLEALGERRYDYDRSQPEAPEPPVEVTGLTLPSVDNDKAGTQRPSPPM